MKSFSLKVLMFIVVTAAVPQSSYFFFGDDNLSRIKYLSGLIIILSLSTVVFKKKKPETVEADINDRDWGELSFPDNVLGRQDKNLYAAYASSNKVIFFTYLAVVWAGYMFTGLLVLKAVGLYGVFDAL